MNRLFYGVMSTLSVSIAIAAPGAHGPGGEHLDQIAVGTVSSAPARLPDGSVNVPKLAQRRMALRTLLARETDAARTVELPGRVIADPNAGGRVQALYGGRLEAGPRGLPVIGQTVRHNEVLAWVRHQPDPIAAANQAAQRAELATARRLAEQRVARLDGLEGSIPRKDIEAAHAELAGLREREAGVSASIGAREALRAPVSGVIAHTAVLAGQVVEARETLFEVIDPARLLVEATTADPALPARLGPATLKAPPGVALDLLGAAGRLRDGVLPMVFRADARSGTLAAGQPVQVIAQLNERLRGIVLPSQAITRNAANEPVVWIKSGAERFIPQPVELQTLDAHTVVVTRGLSPDNRVVVQGASLIAQIR